MTAPGLDQHQEAVRLVAMIDAQFAKDMTVDELLRLAQVKATIGLTAATVLYGAGFAADGATAYEWRKAFAVPSARNHGQKSQQRGSSVASRTDR